MTTTDLNIETPEGGTDLARPTIFVSLELASSKWLVTVAAPGNDKFSQHRIKGGDAQGLLDLLNKRRARFDLGNSERAAVAVIQEAGFDGFWIHRLLEREGFESYVVDPASIGVSRHTRRAKTDMIDGVMLVRTLMAYKRGEPRVCAMAVPPSPAEEDHRRITRERKTLVGDRIQIVNRIQGLLATQGIRDYPALHRARRQILDRLVTGDGRPLPENLRAEVTRLLDRLELILAQIVAVERARDAIVTAQTSTSRGPALLMKLKSIGPEFAMTIWSEGLFRTFSNRRQLGAFAGLSPSPYQSGNMSREQGISKSGNKRLRTAMIELSWLWLRNQAQSALSQWFKARAADGKGRVRRISIVAMARKLLVALWRFVQFGEVPAGAILKA